MLNKISVFCVSIETATPSTTITNSMTYSTPSCDEDFKKAFVEEFRALIRDLHDIFQICGDSACDFTNIRVKCVGGGTRRKRRSTTDSYEVQIVYDSKANSTTLQNLMRLLKENSTKLNTNNTSLIINETKLGDLKPSCTPGSILKDGKCGKFACIFPSKVFPVLQFLK